MKPKWRLFTQVRILRHLVRTQKEEFPPLTGPYKELAEMAREITGPVSRMVAANRTGVSHPVIARLWQGYRPRRPYIITFAQGYRVDPNPLLVAAGYPTEVQTSSQLNDQKQSRRIIREIDDEYLPVPHGYSELSAEGKQLVVDAVEAAVILATRREARKGVIGGRVADYGERGNADEED